MLSFCRKDIAEENMKQTVNLRRLHMKVSATKGYQLGVENFATLLDSKLAEYENLIAASFPSWKEFSDKTKGLMEGLAVARREVEATKQSFLQK